MIRGSTAHARTREDYNNDHFSVLGLKSAQNRTPRLV